MDVNPLQKNQVVQSLAGWSVHSGQPSILFEDNHLLALYKPPGWQTQPSTSPAPDLYSWAKRYLKQKYRKPGNVFLGIVHRLDRPVSGIVVMARTSKAASRLSEAFRNRQVVKQYHAWVEGKWVGTQEIEAHLTKKAEPRVEVFSEPGPTLWMARQTCTPERPGIDRTLVRVELGTGRKHQIRALLAHYGHPILGDGLYGADRGSDEIALVASRLRFPHPTQKTPVEVGLELSEWNTRWETF